MWFYIFLLVVAILLVVWLSRSHLYRHWRGREGDPGQQGSNRAGLGPLGGDMSEGRFKAPRSGSSD